MSDIETFRATLIRIKKELGPIKIAIHNGAHAVREHYTKIDPLEFESTFRVNTTALLVLAQEVGPDMVEMGDCAILVTGNTGAWRGKPILPVLRCRNPHSGYWPKPWRANSASRRHVAYVTTTGHRYRAGGRGRIFPKPFARWRISPGNAFISLINPNRLGRSMSTRPFNENW